MTPLSKLHYPIFVFIAIIGTYMALHDDKTFRIYSLVAILVLQHIAFLLFIFDYDRTATKVLRKKTK